MVRKAWSSSGGLRTCSTSRESPLLADAVWISWDLAGKPGPARIPEDGKAAESWHQLREEFQPLGGEVRAHEALAGDVPAGPRQAGDEPLAEGIG